jgi:hypothetical protein
MVVVDRQIPVVEIAWELQRSSMNGYCLVVGVAIGRQYLGEELENLYKCPISDVLDLLNL